MGGMTAVSIIRLQFPWRQQITSVLLGFLSPLVGAAAVELPATQNPVGYVARLLINEVPFPGERGWISEADSRNGMRQVLLVLDARLNHVPAPYTQRQIATVRSSSVIDVMTAGGVHGQVEGFYRDQGGSAVISSHVSTRLDHLLTIANQGSPGRFARLIEHALDLTRTFLSAEPINPDLYIRLRRVQDRPVTGRAFSWMTDMGMFHPGGHYIRIPDEQAGRQGGNRFFTLEASP